MKRDKNYRLQLKVEFHITLLTHPDGTLIGGPEKKLLTQATQAARNCAVAASEGGYDFNVIPVKTTVLSLKRRK